ncbi:hypothetical protein IWQ62_005482 [Dispira parvispora]|uniref:Uncharacterized protein n=1 Tax=Dispira parvispora TaxID=1520584 RepID=A0A9W8AIQ5_9FUNG|nr:hypothetical protein IWQ62_005482 [Dispira parvispora]
MALTIDTIIHFINNHVFHYSTAGLVAGTLMYLDHPWGIRTTITFFTFTVGLFLQALNEHVQAKRREKLRWSDEVVLVTGAAGGVGQMLIDTLAVLQTTVVAVDVKEPAHLPEKATFYQCDLSDVDQVQAMYDKVVAEIGHPTVLVNNAGVVMPRTVLEQTLENVQKTMQINAIAPIQLIQMALPEMIRKKHGHIVNVSSVLGYTSSCRVTDYAASKAALSAYSEGLRQELTHKFGVGDKVHLTLVTPGLIETPLFDGVAQNPFLMPPVRPVDIVKSVIEALENQVDTQIRLPFYTKVAPFFVGFPVPIKRLLYTITGSNNAMDAHNVLKKSD